MLLKKQTVWLLTMLSLVIVLGVYYVTAPQSANEEFAATEEQSENTAQEMNVEQTEGEAIPVEEGAENSGVEMVVEELEQETVASSLSTDDFFTTLRMEIEDQRSKMKEELQTVVASANVSAEERSEALDKIEYLTTMSAKEAVLETMIKADERFTDAIVKANEEQVRVIVRANEKSSATANELMQLVSEELGAKKIAVEFQAVE